MTHPHVRWTLVPLLAAGGFASAVYTFLLPFQVGGETNAHELLYLLLGSTTLGLTLLAILWYRGHVRSRQCGAPWGNDDATPWTRLKAFAVLVGYAIAAAILCLGLLQRRSAELVQRERQTQADTARSIADAPSAAVPMVTPRPLSEMLLPEVAGAWTPYLPTWSNQAMEAAVPGMPPPPPHRVVYSARYGRQSGAVETTNIKVTVTEFPTAVWATYYLRNIPSPNAQFQQREYFTTIQRDGSLVHQLPMDSFWSSGSNLVTLLLRLGRDAQQAERLAVTPALEVLVE
jgi:hypothetical protein